MFISVFNHLCLKDCHPPELQWCWNDSRLVKLMSFASQADNLVNLSLYVFLLFSFINRPNLCRNKCVIACAKRKRPPLVRGHHWSAASISSKTIFQTVLINALLEIMIPQPEHMKTISILFYSIP